MTEAKPTYNEAAKEPCLGGDFHEPIPPVDYIDYYEHGKRAQDGQAIICSKCGLCIGHFKAVIA